MKTKGSRNIDKVTETMILKLKANHPEWSAEKIRLELSRVPPQIKNSIIPGKRKIQTVLASKDNQKTINEIINNGLDKAWHLGQLSENPIPADALPHILLIQKWAESAKDSFGNPIPPLTIRIVLWISRLYKVVHIPEKQKDFKKLVPSIAHYLYQWAEAYAIREQICAITHIPFDTLEFDKGLREFGEPQTFHETTLIFYRHDNSFYISTINDNLLKQIEAQKDGVK